MEKSSNCSTSSGVAGASYPSPLPPIRSPGGWTTYDCGTRRGITKAAVRQGGIVVVPLWRAIYGRVARSTLVAPVGGRVVVRENWLVTKDIAQRIEAIGIDQSRYAVR